jgi:putative peptidoglycan lipid II flippase
MFYLLPVTDNAAQALAIGVLIAGFVQLLFQVPALWREGFIPRPEFDRSNPHVVRVFGLMVPAIFSVSVAQINTLINTFLASFLVTGSVSWLYFSDRLMEFPVGVFGIALATVVLPALSKEHASGSAKSFSAMMDWALRWVVIIALPATAALYLLATPLLSSIFQYNAFSEHDVVQSAIALQAFAIGVCGFIFVKVLAPGFFARQDTKTPMKIAVAAVIVNIVLSVILVRYLAHAGLALAISVAAWVNAGLLYLFLLKKEIYSPSSGWLLFLLKVGAAVALMIVSIIWLNPADVWWYRSGLSDRVLHLTGLVLLGATVYFAVLWLLGLRPTQLLLRPTVHDNQQ